MERRDRIDTFGVVSLVIFSFVLGFNQVVIKSGNEGFQPVFMAGLRSALAVPCILAWMLISGRQPVLTRGILRPGVLIGALFALEFVFLFQSLDLTTVSRVSVIFYTMPFWLALAAHFLIVGERLTVSKTIGLCLAFSGVAWAILSRDGARGDASLAGDLMALAAALCWAGIGLAVRLSGLRHAPAETQLFLQVAVSAPLLLAASLFFGPLIRDLAPIHIWGLGFQVVIVVTAAFTFWFWLLTIYPTSGVVSFSFLPPIIGVALGWLLLGEEVGPVIFGALALVALGLFFINRR